MNDTTHNNATLDEERQKQATQYARLERRLMLIELAAGVLYLLSWLFLGWSSALKQLILTCTNNDWLLVAAFAAIFGAAFLIIDLPLTYYSGFVLPHRFGISHQTLSSWVSDQIKILLLSGVFGLLILEIIYWVLRMYPQTWWLWAAVVLLIFNAILANLAPVLFFPIFFKFEALGANYTDLEKRLMHLAEKAGTRIQGVYKFDMSRRTSAANAALVGLGITRRVILGDTLLEEFTPDEIETVLAHELGHHVHNDILLGIMVESVITLVGLYLAALSLDRWTVAMGFVGSADIAALPLLIIILGMYGLITLPLSNAYARWRERKADKYALRATGNPEAFVSAMTRLANQNLAEAAPEPWVEFLLHSHPAISKRIAMAQKMKQGL